MSDDNRDDDGVSISLDGWRAWVFIAVLAMLALRGAVAFIEDALP